MTPIRILFGVLTPLLATYLLSAPTLQVRSDEAGLRSIGFRDEVFWVCGLRLRV